MCYHNREMEVFSREDGPALWQDFNSALRSFDDRIWESPTHRILCIEEIHRIRDALESIGEKVMTEEELWNITGDI